MTDLLTRPEARPEARPVAARPAAPTEAARPGTRTEADVPTTGTIGTGGDAPLAWVRLLVALTARTLLVVITAMALWGALPALIGWKPTTVVTGSMEPRISIGDIAVAMPTDADALDLGRVILFDDPDHAGLLRLHRLVSVDDQGLLVTRGDANDADDSSHVEPGSVHGVAVLRVPWIGLPIVWLHEGRYLPALAVVAALAGLMALSGLDRDLRRLPADGPTDGPTEGGPRDGADGTDRDPGPAGRATRVGTPGAEQTGSAPLPGLRRLALVVLLPVVVLGLVAGSTAPAWAAYRAAATSPSSGWSAATYYSCSSAPVADDPSFYWKLDETSGSVAADSSGNNRRGSYLNGFTNAGAACGSGSAITLNGSSQYLTQASTSATTGPGVFSVEVWFRTTTARGGKLVGFGNARTGSSTQYDRHLYLANNGRLVFGVYPGSIQTITSPWALNDGAWHHAVATLSGAGMQLYVDGSLVASNRSVTTAESYSGFWRVGYDNTGAWGDTTPTSNYFAGSLDNVAVYPAALTATQVRDHYNSRS